MVSKYMCPYCGKVVEKMEETRKGRFRFVVNEKGEYEVSGLNESEIEFTKCLECGGIIEGWEAEDFEVWVDEEAGEIEKSGLWWLEHEEEV